MRRASVAGYILYKDAGLCVLGLSMARTIFSASGYITSTRYFISSAQSIALLCSRTLTWCFPPMGSTNAKILHVPLRVYSQSPFLSLPERMGSGFRASPSIWYDFSFMHTQLVVLDYKSFHRCRGYLPCRL